jgi:hypothetical protein
MLIFGETVSERNARRVLHALHVLLWKVNNMAGELDTLTAGVARNTDAIESAITLIQNIKALLDAAGTDPAKLAALSATLGSEDDKLAAAVAANTPAAPSA